MLAGQGRRITESARCDQHVLLADGVRHIAKRQAIGQQFVRINPDAHGLFRTKQLNPAYAINAAQFGSNIARQIVVQRQRIVTPAAVGQADQHQKPG